MIDFRYHLVSLVSVFIALAIGIVLGAGPLRESIGDTLTTQVEALREDKENLQMAVANREEQVLQRDQFIAGVAPHLVTEQLGGRTVVLVTLPGSQTEAVEQLAEQVRAAGAQVTGQVQVTGAWTDPDQQSFRESLAGQLLPYLEPDETGSGDETSSGGEDTGAGAEGAEASADLADVLAWAITTPDIAAAAEEDADAVTVLESLTSADLIEVAGDVAQRGTLVLIVSGAPEPAADTEAAEEAAAAAERWLPLVAALGEHSSGAVLAGPLEATAPGGLVDVARDTDLTEQVSTTDAVDTPMGRVIAVLTLRQQLSGAAGSYGFGQGAEAIMPEPVVANAP